MYPVGHIRLYSSRLCGLYSLHRITFAALVMYEGQGLSILTHQEVDFCIEIFSKKLGITLSIERDGALPSHLREEMSTITSDLIDGSVAELKEPDISVENFCSHKYFLIRSARQ